MRSRKKESSYAVFVLWLDVWIFQTLNRITLFEYAFDLHMIRAWSKRSERNRGFGKCKRVIEVY